MRVPARPGPRRRGLAIIRVMNAPTIIATRESRLALWQAEHVRDLLTQRFAMSVELLGMTTRGDQILDRALSKVGGKGLFVKELETALEEGRAHLAVHSLKDVPMELPPGFVLAAVLEREDPRDAFVSSRYADVDALPLGARVGTSSLRRTGSFDEVQGGLSADNALFEARRCLSCGNCFECDNCYGVCPDNAVIKLGPGQRFAFNYDYCKGCGVCVAECPCGAIEMVPEDV